MKKIELLSPAGSYEGMMAALGAGADAVYLAGDRFGARAYAKNFSQEELLRAIDEAHLYGKRLYLTVNTLLKNRELKEELVSYLAPFVEAGLDAVLVQDFGVLKTLREAFPSLPLHASTQMAVTGSYGIRFLEELGVSRVVPARELSLEELKQMHQSSSLEIEVFIHGAMCYSYSGQCLFSSIAGGRSGNRGRCAQPCRLSYEVEGKGNIHPLSMKDMCALGILPKLKEAGATSLKIEGRMKSPAYAAGVTGIYRKYLDLLGEGKEPYQVHREDMESLLGFYSRGGSCEGYYERKNGPSMIYFQDANKVGKAEEGELPSPKLGLKGRALLKTGEPARLYVSADNGLMTYEGEALEGEVLKAQKRPIQREDVLGRLGRLGDTSFYWEELEAEVSEDAFLPLGALNELRRKALAQVSEGLIRPFRRPGSMEAAAGERLEDQLESQLNDQLEVQLEIQPKDQLEDQPNDQLKQGKEERVPSVWARGEGKDRKVATLKEKKAASLYVSVLDEKQVGPVLAKEEVTGVYLPMHLWERVGRKALESGKEIYLALPHNARAIPEEVREVFLKAANGLTGYEPDGFDPSGPSGTEYTAQESSNHKPVGRVAGFVARNLEGYALLRDLGLSERTVIDHALYTWNDEAQAFFREQGVMRITAPLELNFGELSHRDTRGMEIQVYGYLPLMVSAQCVRKNTKGCTPDFGFAALKDEGGRTFISQCVCRPWGKLSIPIHGKSSEMEKGSGGSREEMAKGTGISRDEITKESGGSRNEGRNKSRKEPGGESRADTSPYCYNLLLNNLPFSLLGERDAVMSLQPEAVRLSFTVESARETERVLNRFVEVYVHGGSTPAGNEKTTKGHFRRGAK